MMRFCLLFLCTVGVVFMCNADEDKVEIIAPVGRIRGSIMDSRLGRKIYSFRGIRYGEPPVGLQRFQVAKPPEDWTDVFDATEDGPACPQVGATHISEDCLRLNVYTTKLPIAKESEDVRRPVLVYIHFGGFYGSSGRSSLLGPQYIMDKDVVLVTINYRLSMLGFISTGDSLAPGNLGLKDQVIALRWVRRNIASFGGDPNSVTIAGDSVGGLSVILHMVSPMSKGLFHRGISMSGSNIINEPFPSEQKHLAKKQAELLGCPTDTTGNMLICLNTKPVENFTDTVEKFFEWYGDPIILWKPVIEPEVNGVERFLAEQPVDLIKQGRFHHVPLICGVTKHEFEGVLVSFVEQAKSGNDSLFRYVNDNWDSLAPISFIYERDTPRSKEISRELRKFYLHDQPLSLENNLGLGQLYADSVIIFQQYRAAKLFAKHSKQPVYFYIFTYQGRYSLSTWSNSTPYGVVHTDDLQYLFVMKEFSLPYFTKEDPEYSMVDIYTSMWCNFVETGEPIPKDNEILNNVTWEIFDPAKDNYLEIDLCPTMKTGIYPERMKVWEKLFPLDY